MIAFSGLLNKFEVKLVELEFNWVFLNLVKLEFLWNWKKIPLEMTIPIVRNVDTFTLYRRITHHCVIEYLNELKTTASEFYGKFWRNLFSLSAVVIVS